MNIKVLFSDMDYTLYRPLKNENRRGITKEDIEAIRQMQKDGFHFVVTTGRFSKTVFEDLKEYGLVCDLITSGGSAIYIDGKLEYIQKIDLGVVEKVFEDVIDINKSVYFRFADEVHQKVMAFKNLKNHLKEEEIKIYRNYFKDENITPNKISISTNTAFELNEIKKVLLEKYHDYFLIEESMPTNLDLTRICVHKGSAIKYFLNYYGLKKEESAGIGDGFNDFAIFNDVSIKFAMVNAVDELKEAANYVVEDIDEAYGIIKKISFEK